VFSFFRRQADRDYYLSLDPLLATYYNARETHAQHKTIKPAAHRADKFIRFPKTIYDPA